MSITIKEIRTSQANKFQDLDDNKLVEAYGTVNVIKKEFADIESELKQTMIKRKDDNVGFDKDLQLTLSFPTGDVDYSVTSKTDVTYTLDISEKDFCQELEAAGLEPSDYVNIKIPEKSLRSLKAMTSLPLNVTSHIKVTSQPALDIKSKKKGGF